MKHSKTKINNILITKVNISITFNYAAYLSGIDNLLDILTTIFYMLV